MGPQLTHPSGPKPPSRPRSDATQTLRTPSTAGRPGTRSHGTPFPRILSPVPSRASAEGLHFPEGTTFEDRKRRAARPKTSGRGREAARAAGGRGGLGLLRGLHFPATPLAPRVRRAGRRAEDGGGGVREGVLLRVRHGTEAGAAVSGAGVGARGPGRRDPEAAGRWRRAGGAPKRRQQ